MTQTSGHPYPLSPTTHTPKKMGESCTASAQRTQTLPRLKRTWTMTITSIHTARTARTASNHQSTDASPSLSSPDLVGSGEGKWPGLTSGNDNEIQHYHQEQARPEAQARRNAGSGLADLEHQNSPGAVPGVETATGQHQRRHQC